MTRSHRRTPISGFTKSNSEKRDKQLEHRKWRAQLKEHLYHERWDLAQTDDYTSNWWWDKDGKHWYGTRPYRDRIYYAPYYGISVETVEEQLKWWLKIMRK